MGRAHSAMGPFCITCCCSGIINLQSPGPAYADPDIFIQAARPGSCLTYSRLDLQRLFLAAGMVNQAGSSPLSSFTSRVLRALRHLTQALMFLSLKHEFPHLPRFVERQKECFLPPSDSQKVPVPSEPNAKLGAPAHRGSSAVSHRRRSGSRPGWSQDGAELGEADKGLQQVQGNASKPLRRSGQAFRR